MSNSTNDDASRKGEYADQGGASNSNCVELFCANCGIKETKDIKLKTCTACKSVHYCGLECEKKHLAKHEKDCKKRVAELRDEILFKQPDCCSHEGDCPICMLPLPHNPAKSRLKLCCSQMICLGCDYANFLREVRLGPERKCPFCRSPVAKTPAQELKYTTKRIEANCPVVIRFEGLSRYHDGKYKEAVDLYTKAAKLGDIAAHYHLATLYGNGEGVEKDEGKRIKHAETAAIGGHFGARGLLYEIEMMKGNRNRAIQHLVIAAKQGSEIAIDYLKECYSRRDVVVKKDILAEALRGYQKASDTMKSPQREAAEAEAIRLGFDGL